MFFKKAIIIDFTLNDHFFFILDKNKVISKKIKNLKKTENIPSVFYDFINSKKIKLDKSFVIFVNIGPGNTIAIRNAIVFCKMLSFVFKCTLLSYSNFNLLSIKKYKKTKALINLKNKNILLDLYKKKVKRIENKNIQKLKKFRIDVRYKNNDLKNLVLFNKFSKKLVPISYSAI